MSHNKLPLSVSIISFNEEDNLARTLAAVASIASEIVIVDSHSIDGTKQIALEYGAKFFDEDWKGFVGQKNSALNKCLQDWILCLDCDEVVSAELRNEIINVVSQNGKSSFFINRQSFYLNKLMRFTWQPDWQLRLVHRNANPKWQGGDVHESLTADWSVTKIKGRLYHYSYKNLHHHISVAVKYARLSAKSMYESGKNFGIVNILLNPLITFIKMYIIKGGFIDGVRGFLACIITSFGTFLKYAFLLEHKFKKK
jgi:glycosyltransferase involved in cell wall biosynthesis